jgi:sodium-dependent dicarboxylate transporter 2/3/5
MRLGWVRTAFLLSGLVVLLCTLAVPPPAGLSETGWFVLGVALLMGLWWSAEVLPLHVTALVPILVFPLAGITGLQDTARAYVHPLVFLFLGGFLIAKALQRWELHRRVALKIVLAFGGRPQALVFGFMTATAGLSMWVSNTATAVLMVPMAVSVILVVAQHTEEDRDFRNFSIALLLAVAYGASIGGVATLIGTPPNALLAAFFAREYGRDISFVSWLGVGLPITVVMLPLAWLVLTRVVYPFRLHARSPEAGAGSAGVLRRDLEGMGPLSVSEFRVLLVFLATGIGWMTRPLLQTAFDAPWLTDTAIGLIGGFSLFAIPAGTAAFRPLLTPRDAVGLPWGILVLFGGGLALAGAIAETDLAAWLVSGLQELSWMPHWAYIGTITTLVVFLTELTSNTATVATLLPILGQLAEVTDLDPLLLAAPAAIAASCAFMLPVATPPNATVFASGRIAVWDMIRAGFVLNLVAIGIVTFFASSVLPLLW